MKTISFRIPGIAETKTTLAQPVLLRIAPWLILLQVVVTFFRLHYTTLVNYLGRYPISWFEPLVISLYCAATLAIAYFLASRIKHGDMVFVWFVRISALYTIVGVLIHCYFFMTGFQTAYFDMGSYELRFYIHQLILFFINTYLLVILTAFTPALREAYISFQKESSYNEKRERLTHRIAIWVIIILPIAYMVSQSAWYWYMFNVQVHQLQVAPGF